MFDISVLPIVIVVAILVIAAKAWLTVPQGFEYTLERFGRYKKTMEPGFHFITPLLLSGLAYSLGGIGEYLRQPVLIPGIIGPHDLFHVAVIAGIGLHWVFVYRCLAKTRGQE